jgi:hypothetical protein
MEQQIFYSHVSNWVRSHRNPETIETLRNFVDKALQPADIKERLYREIDYKESILRRQPSFTVNEDTTYLAGDDGAPRLYASRFSAVCKLAELTLKGYDVELMQNNNQYLITLSNTAPVHMKVAA